MVCSKQFPMTNTGVSVWPPFLGFTWIVPVTGAAGGFRAPSVWLRAINHVLILQLRHRVILHWGRSWSRLPWKGESSHKDALPQDALKIQMDGWIHWKVEFLKFNLRTLNFKMLFKKLAKRVSLTPLHPWLIAWFWNILVVGFLFSQFVFPLCSWSSGWRTAAEFEYKERKCSSGAYQAQHSDSEVRIS